MATIFDERLSLDSNSNIKQHIIYDEHLVRYELAKQFVLGKEVLEIAAGSGYGAKILSQAGASKITAIDIDPKAIRAAKEKYSNIGNIEFIVGDAEKIKQDDNKFDVIISFETIEHLRRPDKFLSQAIRVLKPGGLAIISTPNKEMSNGKNPFHIKEFSRNEFNAIIKEHFNHCHILEQKNGIASYITSQTDSKAGSGKISVSSYSAPLYFIAFCSQEEIKECLPKEDFVSINSVALRNLYNNPGLRLADKVYSIIAKAPGGKKIIRFFK